MINFNFLGLGSISSAQQKGKTNGVIGADSENGSVAVDGESQISDAAFPNVLMQMLLGLQVPVIVPVKSEQQLIPSETSAEGGILTSVKPLFVGEQGMPLQEQSLAGEMKKQSAIQKASTQILTSGELKIVSNQSENIEMPKLLLGEMKADSEYPNPQKQAEITESSPIALDLKINLAELAILPNTIQPTISTQNGENKNAISGEVTASAQVLGVNIPKLMKQTDGEVAAKEAKPSDLSRNNLSGKMDNVFMKEIVQPSVNTPVQISNNKKEMANNEHQYIEIASADKIKMENKIVGMDPDINGGTPSLALKDPLINNENRVQNSDFEVKQKTINTPIAEQEFTSITSNDILKKGILSAVVTHSVKTVKNSINEPAVIEKPKNNTEKQSSSESNVEIEPLVTVVKNETQHTGNSSFTTKENLERQSSSEKNITPVDGRQGQQGFTSIVDEKNNMNVSKTRQTEISSFLRQQDSVNNIVEQLAKNVKVSIDGNNSQIKISLKPEALGEVMLKVTIEQGKVSTQMEVQQPQIKAVIEANLQVLRDSLSSKGLVVDKIDISTAQYSLNEKSSHQGQQRSNLKNYSGKEIDDEVSEQTKLFGYNTVDYIA